MPWLWPNFTMSFIALESTGNLWLTTAVLVAVIISTQITRELFGYSFATWRLHLRGETIRSAADIGWMRELTVEKMMRQDVQTVSAASTIADFRELTDVKIAAGTTGLFMVGGGVPKNFAQDTVVCAEILGIEAEMHKYAVQITVADVRDGACSSSTLKEAQSWGKVDVTFEQMVFA